MHEVTPHSAATPQRPAISVVVPVYCSEQTLPQLMSRLRDMLAGAGGDWEIVLVDDGSRDASWAVIRSLRVEYGPRLVAVRLMRNFGQHNALMCGLRQARGEIIVTLDDDLQHPPEEVPKLIDALQSQQLDLVYGTADSKSHGAWRNAGSALANLFYRMIFRIPVTVTPFRAMRRQVVESILSYNLNFTYIDGLLAWNTTRIGHAVVRHQSRAVGRSGYSLAKLFTLALNLFTNFSLLPLQVMSTVGVVTAFCGLLAAAYYLMQYFLGGIGVSGYASSIIAILVLGGLQLLATGIIGEYIGRVHLNINRKPQYTVREVLVEATPPSDSNDSVAHSRSARDE